MDMGAITFVDWRSNRYYFRVFYCFSFKRKIKLDISQDKQVLTVKRLIQDLEGFDKNATVVIGIRHIEMTVPVGGLMKGECDSGKVAVLVVDPYQVKKAFDFAANVDREQIAQGVIVDGTGNILN